MRRRSSGDSHPTYRSAGFGIRSTFDRSIFPPRLRFGWPLASTTGAGIVFVSARPPRADIVLTGDYDWNSGAAERTNARPLNLYPAKIRA